MDLVSADEYVICWEKQNSNLMGMMQQFYKSGNFTDVRISCGSKMLSCHRIVLAASSTYFRNYFEVEKSIADKEKRSLESPCIIVVDEPARIATALLEFIYEGRVHVKREDLSMFLECGKSWGVKGLSTDSDEDQAEKSDKTDGKERFEEEQGALDLSCGNPRMCGSNANAKVGSKAVAKGRSRKKSINTIANYLKDKLPAETGDVDLGTSKKGAGGSSRAGSYDSALPMVTVSTGAEEYWSQSLSPMSPNSSSPASVHTVRNSNSDTDSMEEGFPVEPAWSRMMKNVLNADFNVFQHFGFENVPDSSKKAGRRYKQYNEEDMAAAIKAVENKEMPTLRAAKVHHVPSRTLYDRVNRKRKGLSIPPVVSKKIKQTLHSLPQTM